MLWSRVDRDRCRRPSVGLAALPRGRVHVVRLGYVTLMPSPRVGVQDQVSSHRCCGGRGDRGVRSGRRWPARRPRPAAAQRLPHCSGSVLVATVVVLGASAVGGSHMSASTCARTAACCARTTGPPPGDPTMTSCSPGRRVSYFRHRCPVQRLEWHYSNPTAGFTAAQPLPEPPGGQRDPAVVLAASPDRCTTRSHRPAQIARARDATYVDYQDNFREGRRILTFTSAQFARRWFSALRGRRPAVFVARSGDPLRGTGRRSARELERPFAGDL